MFVSTYLYQFITIIWTGIIGVITSPMEIIASAEYVMHIPVDRRAELLYL